MKFATRSKIKKNSKKIIVTCFTGMTCATAGYYLIKNYHQRVNVMALDKNNADMNSEIFDLGAKELKELLKLVNIRLDEGKLEQFHYCLNELEDLFTKYSTNKEILCLIAKAHYRIRRKIDEKTLINEHTDRGIEACKKALNLDPNYADAYKWLALLTGARSIKDTVKNVYNIKTIRTANQEGWLFKKYIKIAIELNPDDPISYYTLGRYCYEHANISWFHRGLGSALIGEISEHTFQETLSYFLKAKKCANYEWKEIKLHLAKTYFKLGQIDEALKVLEEADKLEGDYRGIMEAEDIDSQVKQLLEKYKKYKI